MKTATETTRGFTRRKIRSLLYDQEKTAKAANLVYVSDTQPGITRVRKGDNFIYTIDNKTVKNKETLSRIKALVIPPAWERVWICQQPEGHLQVTGYDTLNRKQYRYHSQWSVLRSQTKFFHLLDFGNALPAVRKQLENDLALPGLPRQKVLATVVALMQDTGIRIGSNAYEKLYGSFGLSTLKDKHVQINGAELKFSFKGKKGVYHNIQLKSKKLARITSQCRDIPGKELFQYYDEQGERHAIESGMVNEYIKQVCGQNFTSKDFRTWAGSTYALEVLQQLGCCESETETKRKINEALDAVASRLGNTRTVCRKYYVHPIVISHYTNKTIDKYFHRQQNQNGDEKLSAAEQVLLMMLGEMKVIALAG